MEKPDSLSRRLREEKLGIEGKVFDEGQLMVLGEDENEGEGNAEDVEVEGVDVAGWEKKYRLWVVPE